MASTKEKRANGLALLLCVSEATGGDFNNSVSRHDILKFPFKLKMFTSAASDAIEWLIKNALIRKGIGGRYFLTVDGVAELRRASPGNSTVINNFHDMVGAVQTGPSNTANVDQRRNRERGR